MGPDTRVCKCTSPPSIQVFTLDRFLLISPHDDYPHGLERSDPRIKQDDRLTYSQPDQTDVKTIEGDVFAALVKAGAVSTENAESHKKVDVQRSARTDAGVHAAGNVYVLYQAHSERLWLLYVFDSSGCPFYLCHT